MLPGVRFRDDADRIKGFQSKVRRPMVRNCARAATMRRESRFQTAEAASHSRRIAPELGQKSHRPLRRGRGECRVPNAPAAWCAHIGSEHAHQYSQRRHRKHPAFPTRWFYGFFRALPGDHRFVDPVIRATRWRPRELDACFGAPEPHGFTVRNRKRSSHAPSRPPHPARRS